MLQLMTKDLSYLNDPNFGPSDYGKFGFAINGLGADYPKYTYDQYESALSLLESNKHVQIQELEDKNPYDPRSLIFPTRKGIEAYYDEYYDKENRKDKLEEDELLYRKYTPLISIIIAIIALIISVISLLKRT